MDPSEAQCYENLKEKRENQGGTMNHIKTIWKETKFSFKYQQLQSLRPLASMLLREKKKKKKKNG